MLKLVIVCLSSLPLLADAALAPEHQNPKDLAVMIAFAQKHMVVMRGLRSINLETSTVHFGDNCIAQFGRVTESTIPGPAPALEFKSSNCPVGITQRAPGTSNTTATPGPQTK